MNEKGLYEYLAVFIRPGMREFLEEAAKYFELIIYTAAKQQYADAIIDGLEVETKYFSKRLYRQHCTKYVYFDGQCLFVKQLTAVGDRKLANSVLIDDNAMQVKANKENAI